MSSLPDLIRQRIRQHGPMDMAEYMALCLSHPKYGYYMTRDPFGAGGDFITAPEISQMFGEMIGVWLADLWIKMGSPPECFLVECGPGRGTLMADALRATKSVPGFHAAMKLYLMEISPVLKAAQAAKLRAYDPVWINDLARLPAKVPVLLVCNEFLDALPVHQLRKAGGRWLERVVAIGGDDTLRAGEKEADPSLVRGLSPVILDSAEGSVFEVSPALNQFINSVDNLLITQSGAALFLDYGYAKTAPGETLQAVQAHRFESLFTAPGDCDLTAHVDFENVARIASGEGVAVHGPVAQGDFLHALGIEARATRLKNGADVAQCESIESSLKRLIDTEQMGILFKVMALCHDAKIQPAGFHASIQG